MYKKLTKVSLILAISALLISLKSLAASDLTPTAQIYLNNKTNYPLSLITPLIPACKSDGSTFIPCPPDIIGLGVTSFNYNARVETTSAEVTYGEQMEHGNLCKVSVPVPSTSNLCSQGPKVYPQGNIQCEITGTSYDADFKICRIHVKITGGPASQKK